MSPPALDVQFSSHTPPPDPGFINARLRISGTNPIFASFEVPNAGAPGGGALVVFEIPLAPGAPGNFTVAHHLAAAPAFVIIQMTSGGSIWLQNPTGFDANNIYAAASATGITGTAVCFTSIPDAVVALAPVAPGNFSVPHGLGSAPALALVQMNSGGSIWFQGTPTDATNVNLVASAAGITGNVYVWLHMPTIAVVTSGRIPLAPGAPGNFTVAHGLGKVPTLVIIRMSSGGNIWLQATPYDATNLYLVASAAGITGEAEVWVS